jgi:hypothetical protein
LPRQTMSTDGARCSSKFIVASKVEGQFRLRPVHVLLAMKQQGGNSQTGDGRE